MTVSGKKFFVHVAGKTNDAHLEFVQKLRGNGKKQVASPEESDFLLVFCPVVSRVGTDINVALQSIPGGKPVILVVMHHTFDTERVVAASRRQVDNPNVKLTVDCLFHERSLLRCDLNDDAWIQVKPVIGIPRSEENLINRRSMDTSVFTMLQSWWMSLWRSSWSCCQRLLYGRGGADGGRMDRVEPV